LVPLFDIKREANIPTFFSSLLLTIAALLLWLISRAEAAKKASWALLSVGILLMAIDEIVQFHEDLANPARWLLGGNATGILYHTWVIFGLGVSVLMLLSFWRFLAELPATTRIRFTWAGLIYLSGAIILESINGLIFEKTGDSLIYNLSSAIEEALEMAGVLLLIRALIRHLAEQHPEVRLVFGPPATSRNDSVD
jgi:hypothetical protein